MALNTALSWQPRSYILMCLHLPPTHTPKESGHHPLPSLLVPRLCPLPRNTLTDGPSFTLPSSQAQGEAGPRLWPSGEGPARKAGLHWAGLKPADGPAGLVLGTLQGGKWHLVARCASRSAPHATHAFPLGATMQHMERRSLPCYTVTSSRRCVGASEAP